MNTRNHRLSILHFILAARATNGQYNEHCLPMAQQRDITICTYFQSEEEPPSALTLFDGDNSFAGFFRAAYAALTAQDYDAIHAHVPHTGVLLLAAVLRYGLYGKIMPRSVYTIQNSYPNYKPRNKLLMLPVFALFKELVFCSQACLESFPPFYRWLARNKTHVVQNAVEIARVDRMVASIEEDGDVQPRQARSAAQFTAASIGRLIKIKNPFTLLEAFRQSSDSVDRLVFVGEGDLRAPLTQKAAEGGLQDQVHMTGLVGRDEVFRNALQADVFVSTSYGEGLPVAVIEAMACRCPVILSDIAPHREIAEGVDFIPLLDPDDVDGFAREIARFKVMSPAARSAIGDQCRNLVEERFSLTIMHRKLEEIYRQLPSRNNPQSPQRRQVA